MNIDLSQTESTSVFRSDDDLCCLSWAPYVPGDDFSILVKPIRAVFNHTLTEEEYICPDEVKSFCHDLVLSHGGDPEKSIVMLTAVPQCYMQSYRVSNSTTGLCVDVFCTVGLGNACAPGDAALFDEELDCQSLKTDTINVIVLVNRKMTPAAMLELSQVITMAKCQSVRRFGQLSTFSDNYVLGTGTDCVVVGCLENDSVCLSLGGLHVKLGQLAGAAVDKAICSAIEKRHSLLDEKWGS